MSTQPNPDEGKLITVLGPVEPDAMGITLPHEHLLIRHTPPEVMLTDPDLAAEELGAFARAGGTTLIDVTSKGIGRDPESLRHISQQTGVHIVMAASYYKKAWHPPEMDQLSAEEIEEEIVSDVLDGVGDTGIRAGDTRIRAGVIGEVGVTDSLTGNERKAVIASARAQHRTGAAMNFHIHLLDKPAEEDLRMRALDLVESEGADPNRVVMSHFEPADESLDYHERIARRGAYIEYDLFGMAARSGTDIPDYRMESLFLRKLIDRGLLDRILISQDICYSQLLVVNGGWGYAHILEHVVPRFLANGIADSEIEAVMVTNPRRVFPLSQQEAPDG